MQLNPDFPVISGAYRLTDEWLLSLPQRFNRRVEGKDMVIWRPGFTMWIAIWNNNHKLSPEEQLEPFDQEKSRDARKVTRQVHRGLAVLSYELDEKDPDKDTPTHALYGYVAGRSGVVQIAIYFDAKEELSLAKSILDSIAEFP